VQVLSTFKGSCLEGCHYQHPLYERVSPLVLGGDYITTDSGTGLVHTAPGHGQEDYQVGGTWGGAAAAAAGHYITVQYKYIVFFGLTVDATCQRTQHSAAMQL
jgi:isoleucyl-tRNA synthetase